MSEYQYYEFLAIDRALSKEQMAELRALSTRATITPTRFQNVYNYGDFRGDPKRLMESYFDAFIYVTNWGTRWLMLRLPGRLLDVGTVRRYAFGVEDKLDAWAKGELVILSFRSEDEGGDWEEGDGWLTSLVPLRAELAGGDVRSLYIGWLAGIQDQARLDGADLAEVDGSEQWGEDAEPGEDVHGPLAGEVEPPVPDGLGRLSAPLEALADFLRLDRDLLAVAAERSTSMPAAPSREQWERCLRDLPAPEKDALLLRLVADGDTQVQAEVTQRFRRQMAAAGPGVSQTSARRTVGELLRAAEDRAKRRRHEEAERKAKERAFAEEEQARARALCLEGLAGREEEIWRRVEALVEAKKAKEYDDAVRLLGDLKDLAARAGSAGEFAGRVGELRARHTKKPSFVQRLDQASLTGK